MRAVGHKGGKVRHIIEEDVSNALDNGVRLLALIERVAQPGVDRDDILNVPKYLLDKVGTARFWYDVLRTEWGNPDLHVLISTHKIDKGPQKTHIAQVLHVAYEIAL